MRFEYNISHHTPFGGPCPFHVLLSRLQGVSIVGSTVTSGLAEHNFDEPIWVTARVAGNYSLDGSKQKFRIGKRLTEAVELNKMTVYASRRMHAALERSTASLAVQNQ